LGELIETTHSLYYVWEKFEFDHLWLYDHLYDKLAYALNA
jgi:hypothetical protein